MGRVAIVDYGGSNLDSMARAVASCGGDPLVTDRPAGLAEATHIILPGVGSFSHVMDRLRQLGLVEAMTREVWDNRIPFLGVCLGMQLMAARGTEGGESEGLGWIPGTVARLVPTERDRRIPHVGWNALALVREHPLLAGIPEGSDFYFVHSYRLECDREDDVLATTDYCGDTAAVVGLGHVVGVQFHPEKSQKVGLQLLSNFLAM